MKQLFFQLFALLVFHCCAAQEVFRLAKPIIGYRSVFFRDSTIVDLRFAQGGTQIRYTLNGQEPTETDLKYQNPIIVKQSQVTLKAKVFGAGFLASETAAITFIRDGLTIKSVEQSIPDEGFQGNGAETLYDDQGGIADMHSRNFFGYRRDSVMIVVALEKPQPVQSILLDFLQDETSWIFLPQEVEVFFYNNKKKEFEPWTNKDFLADSLVKGRCTVFTTLTSGQKIVTDKIKIMLRPLLSIPEWHPAKGKQAWLFIDEIKIY